MMIDFLFLCITYCDEFLLNICYFFIGMIVWTSPSANKTFTDSHIAYCIYIVCIHFLRRFSNQIYTKLANSTLERGIGTKLTCHEITIATFWQLRSTHIWHIGNAYTIGTWQYIQFVFINGRFEHNPNREILNETFSRRYHDMFFYSNGIGRFERKYPSIWLQSILYKFSQMNTVRSKHALGQHYINY